MDDSSVKRAINKTFFSSDFDEKLHQVSSKLDGEKKVLLIAHLMDELSIKLLLC